MYTITKYVQLCIFIIYYNIFFSCCTALHQMPSCTYPTSINRFPSTNSSLCPSPPSISLHSTAASGPLDTINTYVAEYILDVASKIGSRFFRVYQAGFTVAKLDPIVDVCDCAKSDGKSIRGCSIFEYLGKRSCEVQKCSTYIYRIFRQCSRRLLFNETICTKNPSCYDVEPYSKGLMTVGVV